MDDVEQKKRVIASGLGVASELTRFGITGVVSNAVLFLGYVLLTELGMGHKTAMTALYSRSSGRRQFDLAGAGPCYHDRGVALSLY